MKEQAFAFKMHLDQGTLDDVIPPDYVHMFIIRRPDRSTSSFYKMTLDMGMDLLSVARAGACKNQVCCIRTKIKRSKPRSGREVPNFHKDKS